MKRINETRGHQRAGYSVQFGESLRRRRTEGGFTLEELAHRVHVTKGYLSRVERGSAKPSKRLISALASCLSIEAASLCLAAGYLPDDIQRILDAHPVEAPAVLREAFVGYGEAAEEQTPDSGRQVKVSATPAPHAEYELIEGDCLEWLDHQEANSAHAVVTDPPYGLVEYSPHEKAKLRQGRGGVWRIPPTLDGHTRSPLPRFTVLAEKEKAALRDFFASWAARLSASLYRGDISSSPRTRFSRTSFTLRLSRQGSRRGARLSDSSRRCAEATGLRMLTRSSAWSVSCQGHAGSRGASSDGPVKDAYKTISASGRLAAFGVSQRRGLSATLSLAHPREAGKET